MRYWILLFFTSVFLSSFSILAAQDTKKEIKGVRKFNKELKDPNTQAPAKIERVSQPKSDKKNDKGGKDEIAKEGQDGADTKDAQEAQEGKEKEKEKVEQLESFMFDRPVVQNRIFTWQINRYLNKPVMGYIDTAINDHRVDFPFYKKDLGATYLGVSGSAALTLDYFQRPVHEYMYTLLPYDAYRLTPDNIQFYNTRAPYTRFTYNGTLFTSQTFDQTDIEVLHTQNITPEWNMGIMYRRYGARGLLQNEATDSRTFTIFTSYSGKRYAAHAGYIFNRTDNNHNGGVSNDGNVLDTVMDARVIPINLQKAAEKAASNTFFLTHSYGIPLNFFRKDADSLRAGEGTMVYFGNTIEYTNAYRNYTDAIALTDTIGRTYYHNVFNIDSTMTRDTMHTSLFDTRVFASLQPFAPDFIISKIEGGIGYRYVSNYFFKPDDYIRPINNATQNNVYIYANAMGVFRRYLSWSAFARYDVTGFNQNDLFFKADASLSIFPLPQGIHLRGSFSIDFHTPDYFLHHYYSNHLQWDNMFNQTIENKIQVSLDVPDWKTTLSFGHALLTSPVVFDTLATPVQFNETVSIFSATLKNNLQLWLLHLDTRVLFQHSSHQHIVPLPLLSVNAALYSEFDLVKKVLRMQLGADAYYNTKYYAYGYNPAAGAFHLQDKRKIGNFPYIDIFINMKWKRATIFVKYLNLGQEWGNKDSFSALHYIRPQHVIKIGISWPFYL
jgi:hypothetical protein